jgi:hypothetical protein
MARRCESTVCGEHNEVAAILLVRKACAHQLGDFSLGGRQQLPPLPRHGEGLLGDRPQGHHALLDLPGPGPGQAQHQLKTVMRRGAHVDAVGGLSIVIYQPSGSPSSALPEPHPPRIPVWTFFFPSSPMWLWTLGRIRHQQEEESCVNFRCGSLRLRALHPLDRHLQFRRDQTTGGP